MGESLPTISKISESFQLSVPTVRTALALLEKDRYIITKAPKAAKVIYKVSQDDYFQYASEYLLARKDGLADIGRVNLWLFGPLLDAGIRQWTENDWNMCWQEIKNYDSDEMSLAMRIYMTALSLSLIHILTRPPSNAYYSKINFIVKHFLEILNRTSLLQGNF